MSFPVATYRLQLRQGMDFARAAEMLPYIAGLGVSHLYLSPIFTAASGSTHGYDVANPAEIDPALGGRAGYERLARAAQAKGLQIILDLVPNHTVLSTENPWLLDALTHGADSPYARYFDVDWQAGLTLPILPEPPEAMIAAGAFAVEGERLTWEGGWLPLAPGSAGGTIPEVLARQHWSLRHWKAERRRLTHRRFFNITDLIGMRVEDPAVFEAMSALPLALLDEGLAQGLRIDHVDGLADPADYLARLRAAAGPRVPIWVEKILTGEEEMPDWPVAGTTGYEASDRITRLLTDAEGLDRLDALWRASTGVAGDYEDACRAARAEILAGDLGAELNELVARARRALTEAGRQDPPEAVRAALRALLTAFPRYRSYITAEGAAPEDRALVLQTADRAADSLPEAGTLGALAAMMLRPAGPEARGFLRRFQQVTGAVVAKSQEDTAFYRHTRCLAEAEVGSEPDAPALAPEDFAQWCATRLARWPMALSLGSTHDTKRAEDGRARILAATHEPRALGRLAAAAEALPEAAAVDPAVRWYALQSALAIWQANPACAERLKERLAAHMRKALREAKEITCWHDPDTAAEEVAARFAGAVLDDWARRQPAELAALAERGERLSLTQLALRCMIPGVPDIYQGTERGAFRLTDPDNRAVLDPAAPLDGFGREKTALLRSLLRLRRRLPLLFESGATTLRPAAGGWLLARSRGDDRVELRFARDGAVPPRVSVHAGAPAEPDSLPEAMSG
jgi:(1->4)-alpha-D-glucan 1-alpha-D-glucosylmutase